MITQLYKLIAATAAENAVKYLSLRNLILCFPKWKSLQDVEYL